ncbi:AfsR/SARP family transcriptional regulator [Streptomyces sp. AN091965]|uniref:AfsR/SARP family transcriptional regulator n=1 Tax=Streptomyces sp. AN091965 TaxID=2927803 RepID=UPI001F60B07B|nr:BTAD domain-containing putative transcriptional regulator [Streptomyces sp. AN091965]MCI3934699.1 tetratricopeptide repeat protein [Streptomyces sp. AN091965]
MVTGETGLRFVLLGRLRAWRGDRELELGSPQQQAFLAVLLLRQERAASVGDVVEALWGGNPPPRAVGALRTYASRLRKLLEPERAAGESPRVLVSVPDGYALHVPREAVDLARFEDHVTAAGRARAAGQLAEARARLRLALEPWRDDPLAGVPGAAMDAHRARLADQRLTALEARLELDLELDGPQPVLAELARLAARHPFRERLRALQMQALHRDGRSAEALALYDETRLLLSEELGLEPGHDLAQARDLLTTPKATGSTGAPEQGAPPLPAQLPGDLADFTGRATLVADLCALLTSDRPGAAPMVAVSGAGGVGKSALAVHVAHLVRKSFPHGQLYMDLQGVGGHPADPAAVLGSFLRALGVDDAEIPHGLAERSALFRARLDGRRVLVLLDNAHGPEQVRPFLPVLPRCAVLVTSRAKLAGPASARLVDLDVMTPDEALDLLGKALGPARVAAEADDAARLVSACGHLPLAVRIVAARLATRPAWPLGALHARLADERHRLAELRVADLTVEAAFALGHAQLRPDQQRAFRLLALPDGPHVSSAAAAAVLGLPEAEAEALCESLVDVSLLESPTPGRYRYHDLLRLYARGRAGAEEHPEEQAAGLRRLLDFLVSTVRASHPDALRRAERLGVTATVPGLSFATARAAGAWLAEEAPCLFAAVRQAAEGPAHAVAPAADLLLMMEELLERGGPGPEFEQAAHAVISAALRLGDRRSAGRAYLALGHGYYYAARLPELVEVCRRAVAASRAADDALVMADAMVLLARCSYHLRRYDETRALLTEASEVFRAHADRFGEANVLGVRCRVRQSAGETDRAVADAERALAVHQGLSGGHRVGFALYELGVVLDTAGRTAEAAARLTEALALFGDRRNRLWEGLALFRFAENRLATGRAEEAARLARTAATTLEEVRNDWGRAHALAVLGSALVRLGDHDGARAHRRAAYEICARLSMPEADDLLALLGDGPGSRDGCEPGPVSRTGEAARLSPAGPADSPPVPNPPQRNRRHG